MNFELKTLSLAAAAKTSTDTLIVLISNHFQAGKEPLSLLIDKAIKAKDLSHKAGQALQAYGHAGVSASKIMLVSTGGGTPAEVKIAMATAAGALKAASTAKALIVFAESVSAQSLRAALLALADNTYVYTATKSKPVHRHLSQVQWGVTDADAALKSAFAAGVAMVQGIEMAKEWANRPANHATPTMLGQSSAGFGQNVSGISCEVLGPKEVAKLGHGFFHVGGPRFCRTLEIHCFEVPRRSQIRRHPLWSWWAKASPLTQAVFLSSPQPEMDEMKFDMGGAASVLGVFKSLELCSNPNCQRGGPHSRL